MERCWAKFFYVRIQSEYRTQCYLFIFLNEVTHSNFLHLYLIILEDVFTSCFTNLPAGKNFFYNNFYY